MDASLREEITQRTNILILGKAGRITGKHLKCSFPLLYAGTAF